MHGFLFCSDHPDCTLLPQAQHIAAALPEYLLDGCMVSPKQPPGHIGLNGACKAAALHPPAILFFIFQFPFFAWLIRTQA